LSLVALIISTLNGWHEKQRMIRGQLNEVLRQLAAITIDEQKLQNDPAYAATLAPAFGAQRNFLVEQSKYLSEQIPKLVTSIEWGAIAYFNMLVNDQVTADSYYSRAVETADPTHQLGAITARAWFLFTQRRFEEARELYKKGLAAARANDNFARYSKGKVHMFWGQNESFFAKAPTLSQQQFEAAAAEFSGIDIDAAKQAALNELNAARQTPAAVQEQTKNLPQS
jgi:tetratricopeptide (TPR) repeat protein